MEINLPALKVKFEQFSSTLSADGTYNLIELQQEFDKIQEKMQQIEMAVTSSQVTIRRLQV